MILTEADALPSSSHDWIQLLETPSGKPHRCNIPDIRNRSRACRLRFETQKEPLVVCANGVGLPCWLGPCPAVIVAESSLPHSTKQITSSFRRLPFSFLWHHLRAASPSSILFYISLSCYPLSISSRKNAFPVVLYVFYRTHGLFLARVYYH